MTRFWLRRRGGCIGRLFAFAVAIGAAPGAGADAHGGTSILYAEALHPTAVLDQRTHKAVQPQEQLQFSAFGRSFSLLLHPNSELTRRAAQKSSAAALTLFRGTIEDVSQSWVRVGRTADELHGMMWDGRDLYIIAPASEVRPHLTHSLERPAATLIFRLRDVIISGGSMACAASGPKASAINGAKVYGELLGELAERNEKAGASVRLELAALGDSALRARYADANAASNAILVRLNNVDGIFSSQLGVEIQVPSIHVSEPQSDPLSDASDPSDLLHELGQLRRRTPQLRSRGLTHLFTGRDLDGTTVGIAYMNSLCHREFGAGLTESVGRGAWIESLIAAHEIGHNFGAPHDGEAHKACETTASGQFLMSPDIVGTDVFSRCSIDTMRPNAQRAQCIAPLSVANITIPADLGTSAHPLAAAFDWSLTVSNIGGMSASEVIAQVLVPPSVLVQDAYVVGGSCTSGAGVTHCSLGDIPGNGTRTIHLTLNSEVVGANSIYAHVQAANDAQLDDNEGAGTLSIEEAADLSVGLQAAAHTSVTQPFTLQYSVSNTSVLEVTNIHLTISVPAAAQISSATLAEEGCSSSAAVVECTLAALAPQSTATGQLTVSATGTGSAHFTAQVSSNVYDPSSTNDIAELTVTVTAPDSQSASKSSSGGGGVWGWSLVALLLLRRGRSTQP